MDEQHIRISEGDNITINCRYPGNSGETKWCRLGSSCLTGSSGSINGTNVTINADNRGVFSVNMSALRPESSGWYLCVKGDLDMPVHIMVTQKNSTSKNHK